VIQFGLALQVLCDGGVEFAVVGGLAGSIHGSARITLDLGICYARNGANLSRLAAALAPFHPRPRGFPEQLPFVWDQVTLHNSTLFTLQTDIGDIDLLGEVAGLGTFEDLKTGTVEVEAYERRFLTIDLRSLIKAKRAAGRPRDLQSLPELEALLEAEEP
jgi:hypothetical protein